MIGKRNERCTQRCYDMTLSLSNSTSDVAPTAGLALVHRHIQQHRIMEIESGLPGEFSGGMIQSP